MSAPNADEWLDAFVSATDEIASTTLNLGNCAVSPNGGSLPTDMSGSYVSLMSTAASLQVGLASSPQGCQTMAKALLGMTPEEEDLTDADLADALGEVVNIIAGGIKTRLTEKDSSIQLGLPFFAHGSIEPHSATERAVAKGKLGELPIGLIVLRQANK